MAMARQTDVKKKKAASFWLPVLIICICGKINRYSRKKTFRCKVIPVPDSSIHFTCANCGKKLKSQLKHAGRYSQCSCGAKCAIPIGLGDTQEVPVRVADIRRIWARIYGQREDRFSPLLGIMIAIAMLVALVGLILAVRSTS